MTQAAHDGTDVEAILQFLHTAPTMVAMTLQWPGTSRNTSITIRKVAQQRDGSTLYRYAWEARGGADGHAWERADGPAYESAASIAPRRRLV